MQIHIYKLDKWKESPDLFETRVNKWIQSVGDVDLLSVSENMSTGDIVFVFQSHGKKKSIEQELYLIAWSDLDTLESAVNNALSGIEESKRRARRINFITTAKSRRALAAFLVEGNRSDPSSGPELSEVNAVQSECTEEKKQDENANAKPKRGRKPKVIS